MFAVWEHNSTVVNSDTFWVYGRMGKTRKVSCVWRRVTSIDDRGGVDPK